jgi:hypothetical protein
MATKCKHGPCTCDSHGKMYCSSHCTVASEMEEEPTWCECGHVTCESSVRQPSPDAVQ